MGDRFRQHGAFGWCELMTSDVEAARGFYAELLGWKIEEVPMEGMTYTVLKADDEEVGGIMAMPVQAEGTPPHWGIYITVDDVDAVASKAQELGAKTVVPLTDIPKVGRFYTFRYPQGAVISIITYARDWGVAASMRRLESTNFGEAHRGKSA